MLLFVWPFFLLDGFPLGIGCTHQGEAEAMRLVTSGPFSSLPGTVSPSSFNALLVYLWLFSASVFSVLQIYFCFCSLSQKLTRHLHKHKRSLLLLLLSVLDAILY